MIGFAEYEKPCWAVFICGTPFETHAGVGAWANGDKKANIEKAKQLLKEAGYKGEKVVHPRSGRRRTSRMRKRSSPRRSCARSA